ncbi:MAG: VOC family protein [Halobacteriota archaeon]
MTVDRIDHFVLTVADPERTCAFYEQIEGIEAETFGDSRREVRYALRFGSQKINLHEAGDELDPHAAEPTVGGGDFCLITSKPVSRVKADLEAKGVDVEIGPTPRTGARSDLRSIYLRDPDGNLVELANEV